MKYNNSFKPLLILTETFNLGDLDAIEELINQNPYVEMLAINSILTRGILAGIVQLLNNNSSIKDLILCDIKIRDNDSTIQKEFTNLFYENKRLRSLKIHYKNTPQDNDLLNIVENICKVYLPENFNLSYVQLQKNSYRFLPIIDDNKSFIKFFNYILMDQCTPNNSEMVRHIQHFETLTEKGQQNLEEKLKENFYNFNLSNGDLIRCIKSFIESYKHEHQEGTNIIDREIIKVDEGNEFSSTFVANDEIATSIMGEDNPSMH